MDLESVIKEHRKQLNKYKLRYRFFFSLDITIKILLVVVSAVFTVLNLLEPTISEELLTTLEHAISISALAIASMATIVNSRCNNAQKVKDHTLAITQLQTLRYEKNWALAQEPLSPSMKALMEHIYWYRIREINHTQTRALSLHLFDFPRHAGTHPSHTEG